MISGQVNASPSEEAKTAALENALSAWHILPALRKIPSPLILLAMIRLILSSKIDVINVHGLGMRIWGKLLSLIPKLPVVATYYPSASGHAISIKRKRSLTFFEHAVLSLCAPAKLIVLSSDSEKFLADDCRPVAKRIHIVPGGADA